MPAARLRCGSGKAGSEALRSLGSVKLKRGVYFAPSTFEAGFVSIAHDDAVIDATIAAARETFAEIAG